VKRLLTRSGRTQDASFGYISFPGREGNRRIHGRGGGPLTPIPGPGGPFSEFLKKAGSDPGSGSAHPFSGETPTTKDILSVYKHYHIFRSIGVSGIVNTISAIAEML
jgi:hypothetical protein